MSTIKLPTSIPKSYPTFLVDINVKPYSDSSVKFDTSIFLNIITEILDEQLKPAFLDDIAQYAGVLPSCKIISLPYEIAVEKVKLIVEACIAIGIPPFELFMSHREYKSTE